MILYNLSSKKGAAVLECQKLSHKFCACWNISGSIPNARLWVQGSGEGVHVDDDGNEPWVVLAVVSGIPFARFQICMT